ncbi:ELMO domain-containing protein A-like [Schistocerca gregaria]|uniref:ELMO domain-containing protein A-like n=1 Tax=Schistocerca gregaria TaxID=7010 RepID=UPI00211DBA13|nr:ELMO domain-containing protein A-like [Schistocerca gregaria]
MVKVKVTFGDTTTDIELHRDRSLEVFMNSVFAHIQTPFSNSEYVLENVATKSWLTDQELRNPDYVIQSGAVFDLRHRPSKSVETIEKLRSPDTRKLTLYELQKTQLLDHHFCEDFLRSGGLEVLLQCIEELQGSVLSHALKSLYLLLRIGGVSRSLDESFLTNNVLVHFNSSNIGVCRSAFQVAALLSKQENLGFAGIDACISKMEGGRSKAPYSNVIEALYPKDVSLQVAALSFVNSMLAACPEGCELTLFEERLEALGIREVLGGILKQLQDDQLKWQVYIYQCLSFRYILSMQQTAYDKNVPDHENLLLKYWSLCNPNVQLKDRVSGQWKKLGFQGTDPASDFRGMGILGLYNLVYFAEKYPERLHKLFSRNKERMERDYPISVAGVNMTFVLYELLDLSQASQVLFNIKSSDSDERQKVEFVPVNCQPQKPKSIKVSYDELSSAKSEPSLSRRAKSAMGGSSSYTPRHHIRISLHSSDAHTVHSRQSSPISEPVKGDHFPPVKWGGISDLPLNTLSKKALSEHRIFRMMLSERHSFEELYCIAMETLDQIWDDLNASYMDFNNVRATVSRKLQDALNLNPISIEQFREFLSDSSF